MAASFIALTIIRTLASTFSCGPTAADEAAAGVSAAERQSDVWHCRGEMLARTQLVGYEPSMIPSATGREPFVARRVLATRTEWRGRLAAGSRYFQIEFSPYTNSSIASLAVVYAGLEFYLMVPVSDRLRLGIYHHSAHNFADDIFGKGINLWAVAVNGMIMREAFEMGGKPGYLTLQFMGHWYYERGASPYVVTRDTRVNPSDIGTTLWRAGLEFVYRHPWGSSECGGYFSSEKTFPPASARGYCHASIALNRQLFGVWSERIQIGPFAMGGLNLQRQEFFGRADGIVGLRLALVAVDTTYAMQPVW